MENKYKYLAKNTALFTISSFGSKILTFLLVPLYTNVLSTAEYGNADIITTTVSLLSIVLTINIASAVMRYALEYPQMSDVVLRYGAAIIVKGIAVMIVVTGERAFLFKSNWPPEYYYFMILIFAVNSIEQLLQNYIRAVDKIEVLVISSILATLSKLLSNIILLVVVQLGITGYLISMVVGSCISIGILLVSMKPLVISEVDDNLKKRVQKEMRRYAIPASINSLGWWVANSVDRYFIVAMLGAAENGIYSVAYKIPTIMAMLCDIFIQAWGISAIKEYNNKENINFYKMVYSSFSTGLIYICSVLIIFNSLIAKLLFAKEFYYAWHYSTILLLSMFFNGLSAFCGAIFGAAKHTDELAISTFISAVINIMLNALLIPYFGLYGAAISTTVSFYAMWLIRYLVLKKYVDLELNMLKGHVLFLLLVIQIAMDHRNNHCFIGQIGVMGTIGFLGGKDIRSFFMKARHVLMKNRGD